LTEIEIWALAAQSLPFSVVQQCKRFVFAEDQAVLFASTASMLLETHWDMPRAETLHGQCFGGIPPTVTEICLSGVATGVGVP
jgi:hypothetical protein